MASALSETTGTLLAADEQRRLEARIEPIRRALGPARCAKLIEQAHDMTVDQAIAYALEDERPAAGQIAEEGRGHQRLAGLTPREQQVAGLIGRGLSNSQIAATLVLSRRTVEWHVGNLLGKLGVNTRAQLATWASAHDLTRLVSPSSA
jgi:non-specific serine/threonine protein kinase